MPAMLLAGIVLLAGNLLRTSLTVSLCPFMYIDHSVWTKLVGDKMMIFSNILKRNWFVKFRERNYWK
ncbi:MAG: hypothetical protein DRP78_01500 [Candidatus Omnitrophota bacterium]|nr:MAG: hypothetical protein DRP78_01500 [Candidatus Omnitrophota bacterium]